MTKNNSGEDCDKFVQASRGPLGKVYEAVRSVFSAILSEDKY